MKNILPLVIVFILVGVMGTVLATPITDEPFRGYSKIGIDGTDGDRTYNVFVENNGPSQTIIENPDQGTDLSEWEESPGNCWTIKVQWNTTGTPLYGQADEYEIEVRGVVQTSIIDSTGRQPLSGNDGSETHLFCFTENPFDDTTDPNAGMVKWTLIVDDNSVGGWDELTSDDGGTPPTGTDLHTARGYVRAPVNIQDHGISNVTFGGSEPSVFTVTETPQEHIETTVPLFKSKIMLMRHDTTEGQVNSHEVGSIGPFYNTSYHVISTDPNNPHRINNVYPQRNATVSLTLTWEEFRFGGDNHIVWNSSVPSGWVFIDNRTIRNASHYNANPNITVTHLLQINDNEYGTPPLSKHQSDLRRTPDGVGFISFRFTNARGQGLNEEDFNGDLEGNEKLWDLNEISGSETNPQIERITQVQVGGGQDGWASPPGDDLLTWDDQVPSGEWVHKVTVSSATDLIGLESNETVNIFLIAKNENVHMVIHWEVPNGTNNAIRSGSPIELNFWLKETTRNRTIVNIPDQNFSLFISRPNGVGPQFWNRSSQTWESDVSWDNPIDVPTNFTNGIGTLVLNGSETSRMGTENFVLVGVGVLSGVDVNTVDVMVVDGMIEFAAFNFAGFDNAEMFQLLFWGGIFFFSIGYNWWFVAAVTTLPFLGIIFGSVEGQTPFVGWRLGIMLTFLAFSLQYFLNILGGIREGLSKIGLLKNRDGD